MNSPQVPPGRDARTSERARATLLVSYTIDESHAPEYTQTYDIAIGGLAMLTNSALAPGSALVIDLELRGDPRPRLRLSANVRWSAFDQLSGKYRTGVSFADPPADFERELRAYVDTLQTLRDLGAL